MIRVDYRTLPKAKPIGGIPLQDFDTACRVSEGVIKGGCLPLFHPHLDRFKDMFNCGVLFTNGSNLAEVEVVGKGFDAADLRLGKAIPHETFRLDLAAGTISSRAFISDDAYERGRAARAAWVLRLKAYTRLVNQSANLLQDLELLDPEPITVSDAQEEIPVHYERMPDDVLRQLAAIAQIIRQVVLQGLPPSKIYVASLSYLRSEGWVLWDVYGDWYRR